MSEGVVVRAKDPRDENAARLANMILEHALRNDIPIRYWYTQAREFQRMSLAGIAVRARIYGFKFDVRGVNPWDATFGSHSRWMGRTVSDGMFP